MVTQRLFRRTVRRQRASNWPAWRGPNRDGISREKNLPAEFGPNKNVAWKTALPGQAGATPVLWGDRIFLSSFDGEDLVLMALNTDNGEQVWKRVVGRGNRTARGDEGNSASPSPSTDGKHVWVFISSGDLACFRLTAKKFGRRTCSRTMADFRFSSGCRAHRCSMAGDYINSSFTAAEQSCSRSMQSQAGRFGRWTGRAMRARSASILMLRRSLYRDEKQAFLVTHGADYTIAHSLKDGSELWRVGGLNPKGRYNPTLRFVASPLAVPGLIVVPSAKNGPVLGLKPTGMGDITGKDEHYHWKRAANTPDVPSPLVVDGILYLVARTAI